MDNIMTDNKTTIGERLRLLRKEKGLTQDDLALIIESNRVQINQWESGSRELPASKIIKISEYFDITSDCLLGIEKNTEPQVDAVTETGETDVTMENTPGIIELEDGLLSQEAIIAINELGKSSDYRRERILQIINGILGSDAFWHGLLPKLLSAKAINENTVSGDIEKVAPFDGVINMNEKFKESVDFINFCNIARQTEFLLIANEKAVDYQLMSAAEDFKKIADALVACGDDAKEQEILKPYIKESENDSKNLISDYMKFLGTMGVEISGK